MKTAKIVSFDVIPVMCGTITCTHCGNKQSAQAWHHERNNIPLRDCAMRCNACGNPLPEPPNEEEPQ